MTDKDNAIDDIFAGFDVDAEECIDFDLTDDISTPTTDDDVVPDYFLTLDAHRIMREVERRIKRRELYLSLRIIAAVVIVLALIAAYSWHRYVL